MPAADQAVRRGICRHQHPLSIPVNTHGAHVHLVVTESNDPAIPQERPSPEIADVVTDKLEHSKPHSLVKVIMDPVRMNTPASTAAGPMVGAKCRRGETTYAMGRLKLGTRAS
jgi:hypothetical protein